MENNFVQNRLNHDQLIDLVQHTFATAGEGCSVDDAEAVIASWNQHA